MRKLTLTAAAALLACIAISGVASAQCCSSVTLSDGCTIACTPLSPATKPGVPTAGPLIDGCVDIAGPMGSVACIGGILLDGVEKELIDGCACVLGHCVANDGTGKPAPVGGSQCAAAAALECNEGATDCDGHTITDADLSLPSPGTPPGLPMLPGLPPGLPGLP